MNLRPVCARAKAVRRPFAVVALILLAAGGAAIGQEGAQAKQSSSSPRLVSRPDLFETLVNPSCSHVIDEIQRRPGELVPDERVLAWIRGYRQGGGIPHRFFFSKWPVISDTYGVFVRDVDAGFTQAFEPSLDFKFHGYRNGVIVMAHKNGTLYSGLTGIAFEGPDQGKRLKPVPNIPLSWGYWARAYPDSVTYQLFEKYQRSEYPAERSKEPSAASRREVRKDLSGESLVLGVELDGKARAYPIEELQRSSGVVRDRFGTKDIVVLWYAPTRTAAAYAPHTTAAPNRAVSLVYDGSDPIAPFRDEETSSWWGIEGRARSGPIAEAKDDESKTLEWLPAVQCKWFAWSLEYPETEVRRPGEPAR
ncbi:MAG TPA: DUF3179 domain-containing (seleno)protein [Planctomycetota bacterium]|jgi:hypothetical protein|nr:DUF3179 domain-containing (seleno)protein [Planctomycetota bacterium]